VRYTVPDKPYVVLKHGGLEALVVDNRAVDGDLKTRWASDFAARDGWLAVDLGEEKEIGGVWISEIEWPETQEFTIEIKQGETWKEIARGTTIGADKGHRVPARPRPRNPSACAEGQTPDQHQRVPNIRAGEEAMNPLQQQPRSGLLLAQRTPPRAI
jgi:hypothetical protein